MRVASMLLVLALFGCTKAGPTEPIGNAPPGAKAPPAAPTLTVQMTAVTLGDDCGAASMPPPPPAGGAMKPAPEAEAKRAADSESQDRAASVAYRTVCEQTSMQLDVTGASSGAPHKVSVRKVELFDDKGALIGELTSRNPTVWSDKGSYGPWDQMVAPAQTLSVSYALTAPNWSKVGDRWNRSYTLKAVITVGGSDRSVQRDVHISAPASLPPDVET